VSHTHHGLKAVGIHGCKKIQFEMMGAHDKPIHPESLLDMPFKLLQVALDALQEQFYASDSFLEHVVSHHMN